MAVAAVAKKGIEKELTCPLCLDIFGEPKKLPCDHIYCKEPCLQGLLLRSFNGTITCPECRTVVSVPQNDLNNLPTAFRINRFKELYREMQQKEESDSGPVEKQSKQSTCTTHASQPLAIYCETCEELLCRDCLLRSDKHKDHDHGFIHEISEKQREAVMKHVETAKECQLVLLGAIEQVSKERSKLETQRKMDMEKLDTNFDTIINALTREKEQVKLGINTKAQQKAAALVRQDETMHTYLSELSDIIQLAENGGKNQSGHEIIQNKQLYIDKLQQACAAVRGLPLQPAEKLNSGWSFQSSAKTVVFYKQGIQEYLLADPQKCQLINEVFNSLETEKVSRDIILKVRDYNGQQYNGTSLLPDKIQVELACIQTDTAIVKGNVKIISSGNYAITVKPQSRGRHVLSVKVNDAHISGSPFSVCVQMPPQQLGWPIHSIKEVEGPAGLACSNDNLYVTNKHQVSVLNKNFELIETHQLEGANEIAVDAETGDWFVTDSKHNQLHKTNKHGEKVKSIGTAGSGPNQFCYPNGIQITSSNCIFVCDSHNNRIKVYDKELHLQQIIGRQGSKKGSFESPDNIAFDETGNLFITDQSNHRVQVLTPSGKTIRTIGKQGYRRGELNNPIGIAIRGRYIYIVDNGNKRISVFTTQGEFVTIFGNWLLQWPECIAIDRDGYVYVSDNRKLILVF